MNEEQKNEIVLKDPEEIEWDELINMFKREADKDNATARAIAYGLIEKLENDEGYFWRMSDVDALKFFTYAGYTKKDDLVKLYNNIRSEERYQAYVERQKANSPLGRLRTVIHEHLHARSISYFDKDDSHV